MRLSALGPDSAWSHALFPLDPTTGRRARRAAAAVELDNPGDIDRFFARMAG